MRFEPGMATADPSAVESPGETVRVGGLAAAAAFAGAKLIE